MARLRTGVACVELVADANHNITSRSSSNTPPPSSRKKSPSSTNKVARPFTSYTSPRTPAPTPPATYSPPTSAPRRKNTPSPAACSKSPAAPTPSASASMPHPHRENKTGGENWEIVIYKPLGSLFSMCRIPQTQNMRNAPVFFDFDEAFSHKAYSFLDDITSRLIGDISWLKRSIKTDLKC